MRTRRRLIIFLLIGRLFKSTMTVIKILLSQYFARSDYFDSKKRGFSASSYLPAGLELREQAPISERAQQRERRSGLEQRLRGGSLLCFLSLCSLVLTLGVLWPLGALHKTSTHARQHYLKKVHALNIICIIAARVKDNMV